MNRVRYMFLFTIIALLPFLLAYCQGKATPSATPVKTLSPIGATNPTVTSAVQNLPADESPPPGARAEFRTDFSIHSVPYGEILSGGPPKDGIPALTAPKFIPIQEADSWLTPQEPVILVTIGANARAYPLQILIWHEIVNDVIDALPVAVTFCPLCNTAIAFDRRLGKRVLTFGTTGRLRFSNLIMYDRETESWWQQATGEAIVGELTGNRLRPLPAMIVAWRDFKSTYPDGLVLSRDTGYRRRYGENPYLGYDSVNTSPFLYEGPKIPNKLPPKARVLTVALGTEAVAYPYEVLRKSRVINDTVDNRAIVIFWQPGTASPLDDFQITAGRDVGTAAAFSREMKGQVLTFYAKDGHIEDEETDTTWDITGKGVDGPLRNQQLQPIISINHFWFSWAAFRPDTRIYQEEGERP